MSKLNRRRDELANEYFRRARRRFDVTYCDGFDAAISELKPEIEKLVKVLEFYASGKHFYAHELLDHGQYAAEALFKFREFIGDVE